MTKHDAGKGSRYRSVDQEVYQKNWEKIFGDKNNDKSMGCETGEDVPESGESRGGGKEDES